MGSIFAAMRRCQLFDGIPEEKYQNVLNCLHGEVRQFQRTQFCCGSVIAKSAPVLLCLAP